MYEEWATCSKKQLYEYLDLQIAGCRTVLGEMHNAICYPQEFYELIDIGHFLYAIHGDLYSYCEQTFYLYRQFHPRSALRLKPRVYVQLFTGEILELIDEIGRQSLFVNSRLHIRMAMHVLVRVLSKLKVRVAEYLVSVDYWQNMAKLEPSSDS